MDEVYAYAGETLMNAIDSGDPVATQVTFTLEKSNGNWEFPDNTDNNQALADCLLGAGVDASLLQG